MNHQQSLDMFIIRLARKISALYPNNCVGRDDYIQEGHLKLAEIRGDKHDKKDFKAYAIIAISRAMRKTALRTMCAVSAPDRIKRQVHNIEILISSGKTGREICDELKINTKTLEILKSLIDTKSWHTLFDEPTHEPEPFSSTDDILSSCHFTDEEKMFIRAHLNNNTDSLGLTRKQQWSQTKALRSRLIRSGYGT